ncbi:MAB_1171c family putative transporter [Micromonospora zamorensis]|uniref:MAB_1171c family putative transporter n=1 Tax=Micromonospora zamorensis TaxID=709883 RepID=UPI0037A8E60D
MTAVDITQLSLIGIITPLLVNRFMSVLRKPGNLAVRLLFYTVLCLQIALVLGYPTCYWYVYRALGQVPSLPQFIQHVTIMAMAHFAEAFAVAVVAGSDRPELLRLLLRRRRLRLLLGLSALTVAFLVGPLRLGLPSLSPGGTTHLGVVVYILITQVYFATVLVGMLQLYWTNRHVRRPSLQTGLVLIATGCCFGILYVVHKVIYHLTVALGGTLPWQENGSTGVQLLFLAPAALSVAAGITIPSLLPKLVRRYRRWRIYRQLMPLAKGLRSRAPSGERVPRLRSQHLRLLKVVIEIRDALVGPLKPYLSDGVHQLALERATAAGAPSEDARAIAEAACIAVALRDEQSRVVPQHGSPPFILAGDLDAEAAWLAKVSVAFAASTLVQEILADPEPSPLAAGGTYGEADADA